MARRPAFTIVELLIVLAIVGILIALTLPAVQMARETARRSQCAHNLRQLGVALQAYHEALGALPPAAIWSPPGEPLGFGLAPIGVIDRVARYGRVDRDTIYANWAIMLLPFLDQQALYGQFDLRVPISFKKNAAARATDVAVLKCPSDPWNGSDNLFERGLAAGLEGNSYARGNFAINVGPDNNCVSGTKTPDGPCVQGFIAVGEPLMTKNHQVWGSGVAGLNRSFRFADLSDGMTNTVVLDEIRAGLHALDPRGVWALGQIGSSCIARHGKFDDADGPNHDNPLGEAFMGCDALMDQLGPEVLQREHMACYAVGLTKEINAQAGSRSLHPGGVHVLACDGSAHFIADEVDRVTWHAIHTRSGRESVESPF